MARIDVSGLGDYIKAQRDLAHMSLRQLANAAEVSNPYLSQVERGLRKPSAEILARIAQGLRISADSPGGGLPQCSTSIISPTRPSRIHFNGQQIATTSRRWAYRVKLQSATYNSLLAVDTRVE